MPTYYARASGDVNAAIWATTPAGTAGDFFSSFTNADVLVANSFTVTLNVNTTVAEIRNDATGGATAGGSFSLQNGVTLRSNGVSGTTTAPLLTFSSAGAAAAVVGNFSCISGSAVFINNANTLSVTGNVTAGTAGSSVHGIFINAAATVNVTGDVNGGSSPSSNGIWVTAFGTGASLNITGSATGGSGSTAAAIGVAAGNVTISVVGNVTGSSGGMGIAMSANIAVSATVIGVVTGGSAQVGAQNNGFGTFTVTRAKGNGFGPGSTGLSAVPGITAVQTGLTRVYEIEYGDRGQTPVSGPVQFIDATSNVALFHRPPAGTKKTLVDPAATASLLPAASNVRRGVAYAAGNATGTCAMPDARSVDYGVTVGDTAGTAILTPAAVFAIPAANLTTSNSIGQRARSIATVSEVGDVLVGAA